MNSDGTSGSLRSSVSEDDETSVSSTGTGTGSVAPTPKQKSYPPTPWEYGTNRCASQKGMGAFGSPRNVVTKVTSTRPTPSASDGVIPKLTGGGNSFPNSAKFQPFGGDTRDVVRKTEQHNEKKPVNKAGASRETDTFLSKWATMKPNTNNTGAIGRPRGATTEVLGSGKRDRRSESVLPKFQDTSAVSGAGGASFQNRRQVTTKVEGLDFSYDDEAKSKAAIPWATGLRSGMQTQSGTGGFLKPRDVCNKTYYDEKKPMSSYKFF